MTVSKEDVINGVEKNYNILGSSDHDHTVVVTAAAFATLLGNQQVELSSTSDDGHAHAIMITCA